MIPFRYYSNKGFPRSSYIKGVIGWTNCPQEAHSASHLTVSWWTHHPMLQFQILLINMLILSLEELYFSQGKFFFISHLNNKISFFFPDFFFFFFTSFFFPHTLFLQGFKKMRGIYRALFFLEKNNGSRILFCGSFSAPVSPYSRDIKK